MAWPRTAPRAARWATGIIGSAIAAAFAWAVLRGKHDLERLRRSEQ